MASIRQTAKALGISPAYLSYMVNGKRPWRPELHERYRQLVNGGVNKGRLWGDVVECVLPGGVLETLEEARRTAPEGMIPLVLLVLPTSRRRLALLDAADLRAVVRKC